MTSLTEFRAALEAHLETTKVKPSRFGKEVLNDPCFVSDIRNGRQPTYAMVERVMAIMHRADKKRKARGAK